MAEAGRPTGAGARTQGEGARAIYTVGHSNHPIERFLDLLRGAGVTLIIDVRSMPASRRFPHFNRAQITRALADAGIGYQWSGDALGGRPQTATDGPAGMDYEAIAARPAFAEGLERVLATRDAGRPALMCAEREPLDCHRVVLVARHLAVRGAEIRHILADGNIEEHAALEDRLLEMQGYDDDDLLVGKLPRAERVARAWVARGRKMTGR